MRYLGLALFAEGKSDYQFLKPLLRRVVEDLCLGARYEIEVTEVLSLEEHQDILTAAREAEGAYDILFIHADADNRDRDSAYAERVQPKADKILAELAKESDRLVGVVPVREMEAWALVDGNALRDAFGTTLEDASLGIPAKARQVETILDPKKVLKDAYAEVIGRSRRRRKGNAEQFLETILEKLL